MKKTILVGIDWQNDFVDPNGALYVKDAEKSAERLAELVKKYGNLFQDVTLTLDSHQPVDIAHPAMWHNKKGDRPLPFTVIKPDEVNKIWFMIAEPWPNYGRDYTSNLEKSGRFALMIWPPHTIIGKLGHNLYPPVGETLHGWAEERGLTINFLTKGSNPMTEHYSAVKAEVPFLGGNSYESDPGTQTNFAWLNMLQQYDQVVFTGQALSHCVRFTLEDTIAQFGADAAKKIVIVRDLSDSVVTPAYDFTAETNQWLDSIKQQGITVTTSKQLPALLR